MKGKKITADKMFEKIGYKKISENKEVVHYELRKKQIKSYIMIFQKEGKFGYSYGKGHIPSDLSLSIFEDEDKAIHKKLEELKNDKR